MYGKLVKITIKPGKRDQFLEFLRYDAAVARAAEPGTIRFDVWDVPNQPDGIYLYEAYTDPDDFARHKSNEPYKRFVGKIDPELIDARDVIFDWTESRVSNSDPVSHAKAHHPNISKLSIGSFPAAVDGLAHFNGYTELRRLAPESNASVAHVHFPPGIHTDWHRHTGQQLLWFTEGEGKVALRDGTPLLCRAGDIVRVDAGSDHWHGASDEHHATHIAITIGETVWLDRPSEPRISSR
jgi:quercetin dioxygenase-like cupin family protein/quinol monooxygenase YgiN